ncbi:hypothetical protein F2Q68_00008874 [Brassica cretica]|uniref:Uncharacterized protein n=1 Tax=Brassica cretica TaxID=69181 RepID=A0A8S9KUC5_BRACR|nr:hypothetical protein F2Q68_00008874 [Brassica cretica]
MMSSFPLVSFLITLMLAAAVCTQGHEPALDTAENPVLTTALVSSQSPLNYFPFVHLASANPRLQPHQAYRSEAWPGCEFSKYWEVDESSSASEEPAILVGGKKRERNSWFRIERKENFVGGNAYKLTTLAGTIGTIPGPWENAPQLVLTNDTAKTFLVKFHKVHGDTTATTSTSRLEKLGLGMFPFY